MESCFVELVKVSRKEIQIWRSCALVPTMIENTSWKIHQEVVWFVQNIILFTK
jgi:hypothetical protein